MKVETIWKTFEWCNCQTQLKKIYGDNVYDRSMAKQAIKGFIEFKRMERMQEKVDKRRRP